MVQRGNRTWSEAPVVIDGANVAGNEQIPGCGKFCWDRVDAVKQAWKNQIDLDATFVVYMDSRPGMMLGKSCRPQYRGERDREQVIEVEFADPEILRLAERTDAAVITNDYFKDFRREHPWLDGNQGQFFTCGFEHGHILIIARDMGTPSEFSKTRAEEHSELKGMGADPSRPAVERALRMEYRCETEMCWLRKWDPGRYTGVPDLTNAQQPRCSACHQPLTILGEAPRLVQLKFADVKHSMLERRTFSPGTSLIIGRDTTDELVAKILDGNRGLISRQHARLDWDGAKLLLTDLNSKNGTTVRRWGGRRSGYERAVRITEGTSLRARDEACLAGVLLITRSARTFTLEPDALSGSSAIENPPTVPQSLLGN